MCLGSVYLALVNRTRTSNAEEAEVERFYEDLQDLLELTCKKGAFFLFIIGDWNAKVGSHLHRIPRLSEAPWEVP